MDWVDYGGGAGNGAQLGVLVITAFVIKVRKWTRVID